MYLFFEILLIVLTFTFIFFIIPIFGGAYIGGLVGVLFMLLWYVFFISLIIYYE